MSIQTRLLLLVLAGMVPAAAGFAWLIVHQREQAREAAYAQVRVVAKNMAAQIDTLLIDSEIMLARLAARPTVRALDPSRCDMLFQEQILLRRESTVFGLRDAEGRLICISDSSNPLSIQQAKDTAWFREGTANNRFTVSDVYLGRASGRWVSNLTYPVRDDAGRVTGLLFLGIDLLKLQEQLLRNAPPSAHLAVFDRQYNFALRSIEPEKWIGTPLPSKQLALIKGVGEAYFQARNIVGVSQLWVVLRVPHIGWTITIGLPEDEVFGSSNAELLQGILIGAGALLLMLLLTWFISRPIRDLTRTSERLIAGDSSARAQIEGPAELEAVAAYFNSLLDERERTLETLHKSEERFILATRGSSDGFWDWNVVTGEDYFSDRLCEMLGYAQGELRPHVDAWRELLHPDDMETVMRAVQTHMEQRTPYDAEFRMRTESGEYRWFRGRGQAVWNDAGQAVRMAGSIVDITERKQAEDALKTQSLVLQSMAEGVSHTDAQGVIRYTNPAFDRIFGYEPGELIGQPVTVLNALSTEENAKLVSGILEAIQNGGEYDGEFLNRRKDGTVFYTRGRITGMRHQGETWSVTVQEDITERKRIEEALRTQTERLLISQRASGMIVMDWGIVGDEIAWSDSPEWLRGPLPESGKYPLYLEQVHPEDRERFLAVRDEAINTGQRQSQDYRIVRTDGRVLWLHSERLVVARAEGKATRMLSAIHDITEQRRAEEALRVKDNAIATSINAIAITGMDGRLFYVNPAFVRMWGYADEGEVIGKTPVDFATDPADAQAIVQILLDRGSYVGGFAARKKDGASFFTDIWASTIKDESGQVTHLMASFVDVTARKQAERALQESREHFEKAFRASPDSITLVTLDNGTFVEVNPSFERFTGYTTAEALGHTASDLNLWTNPAQREYMFSELRAGRTVNGLEARVRRKDGEERIGMRFSTRVEIAGVPHVLSIMRDITEAKRVEQTLLENEARLNSLFEYSPIPVWEEDFSALKARLDSLRAEGVADWRAYLDAHPEEVIRCAGLVRIIDVNQTSVEFFEVRNKDEIARNLPAYFDEEALAVFKEEIVTLAEGGRRFQSEITIRMPKGEPKRVFLSLVVVPGYEQSLARVLVSFMDITEAKRAEGRLRESEAGLREAQQIARLGSWELDLVSGKLHWSDEIFRIFEIHKEKFGASYEAFLDAIHPDDREAVNRAYTASLETRAPYEITHRLRMADGRVKHVQERCETEFDASGKPLRSLGTVQDISERWQAEERMRVSLQEKETLLREIHHRVKNNLQIISSLLHFQSRKAKSPEDLAVFQEGRHRLKSMILVHEKLYQSHDLSRIEFGDYARELVQEVGAAYREGAKGVELKVEAGAVYLPIEVALPLGMLLSELVTNVFKYAFPAGRSGTLWVTVAGADGKLELVVADDGVGLPAGVDPGAPASFGMQLVANLAEQLGAEVRYERGAGLRVAISVPLAAQERKDEQRVA